MAPTRALIPVSVPLPKVLVVDDSPSDRLVLRHVLSALEVDVIEAANGREAIDIASQTALLLILIDMQLPDLGGFDLAREIRAGGHNEGTPVVFMTPSMAEHEHLLLGYQLGAIDYLSNKPLNEAYLRHKVDVYLQLLRQRRAMEAMISRVEQENRRLFHENEVFRLQQDEALRRATRDPLTRLPNRLLFEDRLRAATQRAQRCGNHLAVMFVDLDALCMVSDRYGQAAGDELLIAVARRLCESVRGSDTVARLGGEEFGIVLEGLDDASVAEALGRKLQQSLAHELELSSTLDGAQVAVTPRASIGIALYPDHSHSREELVLLADLALDRVKESGGPGVALYASG